MCHFACLLLANAYMWKMFAPMSGKKKIHSFLFTMNYVVKHFLLLHLDYG